MNRGYFGIGIINGKTASNVGVLWRSATIFGADFIFTIGDRYKKHCSDTTNAPRHIPLYHYTDADDFFNHVPYDCSVCAIEITDKSIPLESYHHRERCIYLLGAEDTGIQPDVLEKCQDKVQLIGDICLNVSVAGSIVMYDRATKRGHERKR